jgi:hypothetical protein
MSTRSLIGIENNDRTVTYVYCHFDGYPRGVGRDIAGMGRKEARGLIAKGDMSSVGSSYHDRGEPWCEVCPKVAPDVCHFLSECMRRFGCDYAYVLRRSGAWMYGLRDDGLRPKLFSLKVTLAALPPILEEA